MTKQLRQFGVKERFAKEMHGDMICPAVDFLQSFSKCCRCDKGWRPLTLMAEATAQVAAIGNLDKDFFEFSQCRSVPGSMPLAQVSDRTLFSMVAYLTQHLAAMSDQRSRLRNFFGADWKPENLLSLPTVNQLLRCSRIIFC